MKDETLSDGVVNIIRGITRPICTFFGLFSCVMIQVDSGEVPAWLLGFTGGMLAFWFGDRFLQHWRE